MTSHTVLVLGSEGDLGKSFIQAHSKTVQFFGVDRFSQSQHDIAYNQADFSNLDAVKKIPNWLTTLPPLDAIVSTIGSFGTDNTQAFSIDQFIQSLHINVIGISALCIELALSYVKQNKPLKFVIIGSAAAHVGSKDLGYSISKAGLNGLVTSLSKNWSAKHITSIGINPGIFESKMSQSVEKIRQQKAIEATHIKRIGEREEIIKLMTFATFEAPAYMTGSILHINGGQYI